MKRLHMTFHLLCLGFVCLLPACHDDSSPSNPTQEPAANATTVVKDGVRFLLQTDKRLYHLGEPVQILYRATNTTNKKRGFGELVKGDEMTVLIDTDKGQRIWTYMNKSACIPQGSSQFSLEPKASIERSIEWMMVNDNGTLCYESDDFDVAPQRYIISCGMRNHPEIMVSLSFQIQ